MIRFRHDWWLSFHGYRTLQNYCAPHGHLHFTFTVPIFTEKSHVGCRNADLSILILLWHYLKKRLWLSQWSGKSSTMCNLRIKLKIGTVKVKCKCPWFTFSWFVFVKNQIYKRLFWSNIWKKKSHHWLLFFSGS
jgi:hypothetical protein